MSLNWDVIVVGGGFYGLYLAEFLAGHHSRVRLVEREPALMRRASYTNQARVHQGYHYPRSVLTAQRSQVNFPRFVEEFRPAIDDTFEKIYAIARGMSKVTAEQFFTSMSRIGAPIRLAEKRIRNLFDFAVVDDVFLTQEYAFDSVKLMGLISERVKNAGVEVSLNTNANRVQSLPGGGLRVELTGPGGDETITAGDVFVCGYAQTNAIAIASGLPVIPLKHELAEMSLVAVPPALRKLGITVMDGPFFSCMPFPPRGLHTLSHVRYTPHGHWLEDGGPGQADAYRVFDNADKRTAFAHMVRDAMRFVPSMAACEYRDSLWDVKTVLPRSEADDSRPILFRPDHGAPGYHVVMGGKIDNVYDIADEIRKKFGWHDVSSSTR